MAQLTQQRGLWLVLGILLGLALGTLAPPLPLHATATSSNEGFSICTGELEPGFEGIYFLDFQTGDLRAMFLNPRSNKFTSFYEYNVLADFKDAKTPKFLMVSGHSPLLSQGNARPSTAIIYVVEINSGIVNAYVAPYPPNRTTLNSPISEKLVKLDSAKFRSTAIRENK